MTRNAAQQVRCATGARLSGRVAIMALAGGALVFTAAPAWATPSDASHNDASHNKVTICHATGSDSNPYVVITPDAAGVANGHYDHQDGRDIIPPFTYQGQSYPGHNWEAGQTTWKNGCQPSSTPPGDDKGGDKGGDNGQPCPEDHQPGGNQPGGNQPGGNQPGGNVPVVTPPVSGQPQPQAVVVTAPVSAATPVAATAPVATSAPIPTGASAGQHAPSEWQLPVGASLLALGAVGTAGVALRRRAAEH